MTSPFERIERVPVHDDGDGYLSVSFLCAPEDIELERIDIQCGCHVMVQGDTFYTLRIPAQYCDVTIAEMQITYAHPTDIYLFRFSNEWDDDSVELFSYWDDWHTYVIDVNEETGKIHAIEFIGGVPRRKKMTDIFEELTTNGPACDRKEAIMVLCSKVFTNKTMVKSIKRVVWHAKCEKIECEHLWFLGRGIALFVGLKKGDDAYVKLFGAQPKDADVLRCEGLRMVGIDASDVPCEDIAAVEAWVLQLIAYVDGYSHGRWE